MSELLPKLVSSRLASLEARSEAWHPDADLLTAFLEQGLPQGEQGVVLSHLAGCGPCREIASLAQPSGVEVQTVLAAPKSGWLRGFWRWGALAACAVVAVSLVLHKRENRSMASMLLPSGTGTISTEGKPSPNVRTETDTANNQNTQAAIAGALQAERRVAPLSVEPAAPPPEVSGLASNTMAREEVASPALAVNEPADAAKMKAQAVPEREDAKVDQLALKKEITKDLSAKPEVLADAAVPATPVAPTDKGDFRASAAPMANFGALSAARAAAAWQLTDAGDLQRSVNGGKDWESVSMNQPARLRVVATTGLQVWAGGNAGLLFLSQDGGGHFTLVRVQQGQSLLTGDIVALAFSGPQHGRLETSAHDVWTTSDGGKSWQSSAAAK